MNHEKIIKFATMAAKIEAVINSYYETIGANGSFSEEVQTALYKRIDSLKLELAYYEGLITKECKK